jgi:NAD(P)-dependent dehydrogenase (short-subunit alcohol dehydrogenase family)
MRPVGPTGAMDPAWRESASVSSEPQLAGQTVLVMDGSAGIGLETAELVRAEGADVILTARDPDRLHRAGLELGASIAAFDSTDFDRLGRFFDALPRPIDHLMLSAGDQRAERLANLDLAQVRHDAERSLWLPLRIAQLAITTIRPGGSLVFLGGTVGRRPSEGPLPSALTAAMSALTRSLAVELAPVRVNLVSPAGAVGSSNVAAAAVHLMVDSAITGATLDVDSGGNSCS